MPEVNRERLVDALQGFHLWITADRKVAPDGRSVFGTVQDPESMADGLLLALRANAAHEADGDADDLAGHLERAIRDGLIGPGGFVVHAVTAGKVLGVVMGALALHEGNRQRQATAADDLELSVMADIVRLMEAGTLDGHAVVRALYPLDGPALVRVLRWLLARFPADED